LSDIHINYDVMDQLEEQEKIEWFVVTDALLSSSLLLIGFYRVNSCPTKVYKYNDFNQQGLFLHWFPLIFVKTLMDIVKLVEIENAQACMFCNECKLKAENLGKPGKEDHGVISIER